MIINNVLNQIFTSTSITLVLRELVIRKSGITGREVARLSGITHRSAIKALENLELLNLVKKQVAGRTYYFTINREHYLYKKAVEVIFNAEEQFPQELYSRICSRMGELCESIIVFGSVARKEETAGSDLDLCFVYRNKLKDIEKEIQNLRYELHTYYGVVLAPLVISSSEFRKKGVKMKPPINNIISDGIVICGKQPGVLLNE